MRLWIALHAFLGAWPVLALEPFALPPPAREVPLAGHVEVLRDPGGQMTLAEAMAAKGFRPVVTRSIDEGYTHDIIWFRFAVENRSGDTDDWRLHFRENFLQILDVWQIAPGEAARHLVSHRPDTPFSARAISYPELVVALRIPAGERHVVYARYSSGGSSQLFFSFRSKAEFDDLATRKTARNFVYYGMLILLTLGSAIAWVATRRPVFGAYAGYVGFGLLFIMHADGNAFRHLWPEAPLFNGFASVIVGTGIAACGANFARLFLATGIHHPVIDKILRALIVLPIAMTLSTVVVDTQLIKKALVLTTFTTVLMLTLSGLVAARRRFREVRFYVIAWLGALISSGIMASRHLLGIEISEEVQFDSMRIVFVSDAALMGLAILDRINQMRAARAEALELSLAEARRNIELNERLRRLEERHALAEKLVERKDRRLADTVHDLSQPLHALRLNIRALSEGEQSARRETRGRIEEMFDYLEALVGKELATGVTSAASDPPQERGAGGAEVSAVLARVLDMFAQEARAKGLALRCVRGQAHTVLSAVELMRAASNLVSNAIKYTERGTVLSGLRWRGGIPWLEVHDTGIGMSQAQFSEACGRASRLPQGEALAEGAGLGLAIVADLARRHGLSLRMRPRPSGGSVIALSLRPEMG